MNFTKPIIDKLECQSVDKPTFYWESATSGFGVKVTPKNKKTYVFQGRVGLVTRRITIGNVKDWRLADARERAKELAVMCMQGIDPKVEKTKRIKSDQEFLRQEKLKEILFKDAWQIYLDENKERWRARSYIDHLHLARGGWCEENKFNYKPQPIYELLNVRLADLKNDYLANWVSKNNYRATSAGKAFRIVRAFINWCEEDTRFKDLVPLNAIRSKKVRTKVKAVEPRKDCLTKEQLKVWFECVLKSNNQALSTFYIACLLTGARKDELLSLQWGDIDFKWKTIQLKDKVDDSGRTIPMTEYLESLLSKLKSNESLYVFSSKTSVTGYIVNPYKEFKKICHLADVNLTIHGLRRSFKSLAEWINLPVGVTAQISGHKPSALVEKHYTVRPMDMLRGYMQQYEDWILEQAGI